MTFWNILGAGSEVGLLFSYIATEYWKNEAVLMEKLKKQQYYEVIIQYAITT